MNADLEHPLTICSVSHIKAITSNLVGYSKNSFLVQYYSYKNFIIKSYLS